MLLTTAWIGLCAFDYSKVNQFGHQVINVHLAQMTLRLYKLGTLYVKTDILYISDLSEKNFYRTFI